ncbi:MAG: hypothetical protein EOQ32_20870 [Mesorhizobium sp.]|nr:MAG: hypothetical protein EOQ32_20870 [Mesorhizobium sp.]
MRGAPAWRRRRRRQVRQPLTPLEHPSTVSALRADPPSPTRGEGEAHANPLSFAFTSRKSRQASFLCAGVRKR